MVKKAETMVFTADALQAVQAAAQSEEAESLLEPGSYPPNVVGVGAGAKWTNGRPTGEPAVVVLVSQKLGRDQLSQAEMIPAKVGNIQTDVLAVGNLFAGGGPQLGVQTLARRIRPVEGGYSVGHFAITAGTVGTCVYDMLPGGNSTSNPPLHGLGIPPRFYILSNNHVLANSNNAIIGDAVLQPGPIDGGTDPADRIATLSRFVPITFSPPVPLILHNNLVDAAVAQGQFHDLDREIFWNGYVRGWRRKADVKVGDLVKKTGRTTNFTTGRITVIGATVDINYGGGRVARFSDQIVLTNMSAGGDSGSLILSLDNVAVGLLFAGSSQATIANQIEHVRSLLRVEVAEQVM